MTMLELRETIKRKRTGQVNIHEDDLDAVEISQESEQKYSKDSKEKQI